MIYVDNFTNDKVVWYVNTKLHKFLKEHKLGYSVRDVCSLLKVSACILSLDSEPLRADPEPGSQMFHKSGSATKAILPASPSKVAFPYK
ncbi:hypothetical protein [Virgibacillus pantothenticus]|uniref:hypothetical protein n=1 Tax=Virgibacillus pantothenticus TaxID=1473 RepID=UPI000986168D|nr:hypothetical protein [Virgibacillus pantothenticus]